MLRLAGNRRATCTPTVRGLTLWGCAALLAAGASFAADPLETGQCGTCHRLAPPATGERGLSDWMDRKGPDLFYAGTKYQAEWLRA